MKTQLFNYLRFTRTERQGTLALFVLAGLALSIPSLLRYFPPERSPADFTAFQSELAALDQAPSRSLELFYFNPNTATTAELMQLGLSEKLAATIEKYRNKGGKFREPADFGKIWGLTEEQFRQLLPFIRIGGQATPECNTPTPEIPPATGPELFAFDLNAVTEAELFRMGLPSSAVKSILNYRIKGGVFRKPDDLKKIYGLSAPDLERLLPYAQCAAPEKMPQAQAPKMPETPILVDVNLSGLEQWKTLPGIGEARARQLIQYREKLGGFQSVEQIAEMRSLPDSVFRQIRPWLHLGATQLRKINLNTASVADLDAHPYISKRQAELIVAYREQHGAYQSPDEIAQMRAIADQAWLNKVKPYLGVQ
ncbi:MAG: helix-hairpin-helix domain-containing protein [Chitinophagales bacterium]|nr:helix-hairpin-helix domain-containing protein [Chitinophagales bacterium]